MYINSTQVATLSSHTSLVIRKYLLTLRVVGVQRSLVTLGLKYGTGLKSMELKLWNSQHTPRISILLRVYGLFEEDASFMVSGVAENDWRPTKNSRGN